jgi:hypothetical protein
LLPPVTERIAVVEQGAIEVNGAEIILVLLGFDKEEEVTDFLLLRKHEEEGLRVVPDRVGHTKLPARTHRSELTVTVSGPCGQGVRGSSDGPTPYS